MTEHQSPSTATQPAGWPWTYVAIWIGQQFSIIGSSVAHFALVWWVTDTTGSAATLATASLVGMLPGSLLGPFIGAIVDRYDRRQIMIIADSIVALFSLWLGYLFWADQLHIWHVYIILFGQGLGGAFHWPAMAASTPMLVPARHLVRVEGWNQTMSGVRRFAAPPLGALILSLLPLHWIMGIDVITATIAVLTLVVVAIPNPVRKPSVLRGPAAIWHDTLAGVRFLRHWRGMLILLTLALVANLFGTPMYSLLPLLVRNVYHGGAPELAMTQSAFGVGWLVGGLLLSTWGGFRRRIMTTILGMMGIALSSLVAGVAPSRAFWALLVGWGLGGLSQPLANGPIGAIFQAKVPKEAQGRVFTLMGTMSSAMTPLGYAIAGPVADALGLRSWYIASGVAMVAAIAIGLLMPDFMQIEELPAPTLDEATPPKADLASVAADTTAGGD